MLVPSRKNRQTIQKKPWKQIKMPLTYYKLTGKHWNKTKKCFRKYNKKRLKTVKTSEVAQASD